MAAKRNLSFVGLRLVGMDFDPGGWKTVGGPLVDWVALIVAAERCLNKTNNKHHYDVILCSVVGGERYARQSGLRASAMGILRTALSYST